MRLMALLTPRSLMNAKLQSRFDPRKAGSMKRAIAFITTLSRTVAICSGRGFFDPGLLIAWARSLLNTYMFARSSALISERFSSSRALNAFIVTLSSPLERIFRLEMSCHALRRDCLSETVRRADTGFMTKYLPPAERQRMQA